MALGLSTWKALSILKEQLEAVLEGHLKERKKRLTWKVGQSLAGAPEKPGPVLRASTLAVTVGGVTPPGITENHEEVGVPGKAMSRPLVL